MLGKCISCYFSQICVHNCEKLLPDDDFLGYVEQEPHEGSCYSLLGCFPVHVLGVGQAGLAVVPVHEEVEDRAALGGVDRRRDAGLGINAFLSVFIHSVRRL